MSSTSDASWRSCRVRIRFWTSSALIPLYVHTTATTGMSISGKISIGIRVIDPAASMQIRISVAITEYGRLSTPATKDIRPSLSPSLRLVQPHVSAPRHPRPVAKIKHGLVAFVLGSPRARKEIGESPPGHAIGEPYRGGDRQSCLFRRLVACTKARATHTQELEGGRYNSVLS